MKKYVLCAGMMTFLLCACHTQPPKQGSLVKKGYFTVHVMQTAGEKRISPIVFKDEVSEKNDQLVIKDENIINETKYQEELETPIADDFEYEAELSTDEKDKLNKEDKDMHQIIITINNQSFSVTLYENEAVQALLNQMPFVLTMTELNGNEKYAYLDHGLPIDEVHPEEIHTGDLMLFGSDCLVLFYDDFASAYSYTKIGRVNHPEELAETLGTGNVQVMFAFE